MRSSTISAKKRDLVVTIKSPWGWLAAAGTRERLQALVFGHVSAAAAGGGPPVGPRGAAPPQPPEAARGGPLREPHGAPPFEDAHRLYRRHGFRNHRFRYAPDPWASREWGFVRSLGDGAGAPAGAASAILEGRG